MKKIIFLGVVILFAMNAFATVQVTYGKNPKTGHKQVILKNSLLTAVINSDRGGMLESFIPINSKHEEVYISSDNKGGMCEHIIAGSNQNREVSFSVYSRKFSMAILSLFRSTSTIVPVISLKRSSSVFERSSWFL